MQYIYPQYLPSPLQGVDTAVGTLAEAVIKSREKQALMQDTDLIGQALAKAQGAMQPKDYGDVPEPGETSGNPMEVFQEHLPQMKTPQGRLQLVKLMMQMQPQPVYGYEGGELVRKGSLPKGAQVLKPDPAALEEQRLARQSALEEQKQAGREKLQEKKEAWQTNLEARRQEARDSRDWQRYKFMGDMLDKRLTFQEKIQQQKTSKDRTEYARRELVNIKQRARENFNRRVGTINKEFKDVFGNAGDEKDHNAALAQARQEYEADLGEIQSAYKDVIDKYGLGGASKTPGGQPGRAMAAFRGPGRYRSPDGEPVVINTQEEYQKVFGR